MVGRRALVIGLVVLLIASGCIGGPAPNSDVRERQLLERVNALEEENAGLREMLEQFSLQRDPTVDLFQHPVQVRSCRRRAGLNPGHGWKRTL